MILTFIVTLLWIYCEDGTALISHWRLMFAVTGITKSSDSPGSKRQIRDNSVHGVAEAVGYPLRSQVSSACNEILNVFLFCTLDLCAVLVFIIATFSSLYQRVSLSEKVSETCWPWLIAKIHTGVALSVCIIHFPYCSFHMLI